MNAMFVEQYPQHQQHQSEEHVMKPSDNNITHFNNHQHQQHQSEEYVIKPSDSNIPHFNNHHHHFI